MTIQNNQAITPEKTITVTSQATAQPIAFTVRWLEKGDAYGLNGQLTYDSEEPCVEFYDQRHRTQSNAMGQFVSRYYVSSLSFANEGLNLHGGVPDWRICAPAMNEVRCWIHEHIEQKQLEFLLSPKKHHDYRVWLGGQQNTQVSDQDILALYDTPAARQAHDSDWLASVRQAFANNTPLLRQTLDSLEKLRPGAVASLWHDYPDARVPEGYVIPEPAVKLPRSKP